MGTPVMVSVWCLPARTCAFHLLHRSASLTSVIRPDDSSFLVLDGQSCSACAEVITRWIPHNQASLFPVLPVRSSSRRRHCQNSCPSDTFHSGPQNPGSQQTPSHDIHDKLHTSSPALNGTTSTSPFELLITSSIFSPFRSSTIFPVAFGAL